MANRSLVHALSETAKKQVRCYAFLLFWAAPVRIELTTHGLTGIHFLQKQSAERLIFSALPRFFLCDSYYIFLTVPLCKAVLAGYFIDD